MNSTRDRTAVFPAVHRATKQFVGRRRLALVAVLPCVLGAAGCGSNQDVLDPKSHQARSIATLWWVMMGGAWVGFAVVVFLLYLGWRRRHRTDLPLGGGDRAATTLIVTLGIAVPALVLILLFVWSDIFVLRSTAAPKPGSAKLTVEVVGHQWFWE